MGFISERIQKAQTAKMVATSLPVSNGLVMWTSEGARFQEWALSQVGTDKSLSGLIGRLVTKINNSQITLIDAQAHFNDALWAGRN